MGSTLMQHLLCARLGGRQWADLRVQGNLGAQGRPHRVAGGGHPPSGEPQFPLKRSAHGRPGILWGVEWIGECWGSLGLSDFTTGKVNLCVRSVMKGEGSSCISTTLKGEMRPKRCHQPGKSKKWCGVKESSGSGEETQLSFLHIGAGRSRMVGWSDGRKALV